jgi:hypothetical protein
MPGRTPYTLLIALLWVLVMVAPAGAGSPELVCGELPFGKYVEDVLKIYKATDVVRQETPYIESIGNYALEKYFKGGLKKDESGICFLPKIVQKYTISHKGWKNCDSMVLYFGAFQEAAKEYSLFMVKRTRPKPPAESDFKQVFNNLSEEMDKSTGTSHSVDQGRIQSFNEQSHTFYFPALIGTWEAKDTLVFVMVANSPDGPLPPEEIFVSKPALKRYLEICKTY